MALSMRRFILAVVLWFAAGTTFVQAVHALAHEHHVGHSHHHEGDADHGENDADHAQLVVAPAPVLTGAAPRVKASAQVVIGVLPASETAAETPRSCNLDTGPPDRAPSLLLSAAPSNRAPPA